jgi:biopolymer transport protein ExbD
MAFTQREARKLIRRAVSHVPEGEEIRHLNIMPMMDMMTILLVAFIFQIAVSATEATAAQVSLPQTVSADELPENAATLIITRTGILGKDARDMKQLVGLKSGGTIDCNDLEDHKCDSQKIPTLVSFLANFRAQEIKSLQESPNFDPKKIKPGELMIIADRTTPFHVLVRVMYSAKQKEAGYKHFRLIVQKSFPPGPPNQ